MSTLIGLICVLCIRATHAVTVSLCSDNAYLEVKEGRDDNRFVCTGLTDLQTVSWFWGTTFILKCTPSSCDANYFPTQFKISRTLPTESDITVNATTFSAFDSSVIGSLTCQVSNENKDTCQLDVVYPAENPKCEIQFSGNTWELTGWCNVSKVRSKRNRYACDLYINNEQSPSKFVGSFRMSLNNTTEVNYFSGVCEIKSALPPDGKYNYSVIIKPGEVEVRPFFSGSNVIQRPTEPPTHNCPQAIREGDSVDCRCYSDNLGLPTGVPVWKETNSSQLTIIKVNRTYSGKTNTCNLMWNNTAVQNVTYTIIVNFASKVQSFKINKADNIVNVSENTNVSAVCQAEGRPLPTIRLFKKSSDNQDLELSLVKDADELSYNLTAVKCEATGNYSCQSENSVFWDRKYIALIVFCSPKKATNDTYVTTFENGQASLTFKIIAYPPPDLQSIFYIGSANPSSSQQLEHKNTAMSTCSSDEVYSYMITCAVTLHNETAYATGFYNATFGNTQASVTFTFEVKEKIQTTTELSSKGSNIGGIIGGVIGGVVLIALAVVIIIFIVRRNGNSCKRRSQWNKTEETFSGEQSNRAETQKEVNATIEKKSSAPTKDSTLTDVYAAVVKKTTEQTEIDSSASSLSPTHENATTDKKVKLKFNKIPGKEKKKGKGDKKPLAAKSTGPNNGAGALSMSPMTESEYQNLRFDKEQGKERKGAKEIQRRNHQGLNYTTVVFDNTKITPTPPPTSEPTVYAEIVSQSKPKD